MREPLDHDDHFDSCCDPVDDEIKKLTGDNRALRMILRDCLGVFQSYSLIFQRVSDAQEKQRLELLVQQIDDELKSE
jgi:hypothetical protein